jgi:hypothetical protein
MNANVKATLVMVFLLAACSIGCGVETEYAGAGLNAPVCHAPDPEVGYTTVSDDGAATYWTECLACDDGSVIARTWGPSPRDGQTGSAITSGPSCDSTGDGNADAFACATAAKFAATACAPRPAVQ